MAFQPIVDTLSGKLFAFEALVRGPAGQGAASVLGQVNDQNRYGFDQNCRVVALTKASELGLLATGAMLSINFMPGAVYSPAACIQLTLKTAEKLNFPLDRLIFEITEEEKVDRPRLRAIVSEYRRHGFRIAIDDFGAGYSGINLLADFPTDILKLDMELIRGVDKRPRALRVLRHIASMATDLGSLVIAEGIETIEEYAAVRDCGITLMQGYLFAKPGFECLPGIDVPASFALHGRVAGTPLVQAQTP